MQVCYKMIKERGRPYRFLMHSKTSKDVEYEVYIGPFEKENSSCECRGFEVRGHCSHIDEAWKLLRCGWDESKKEQQDEYQKENNICPRCGGRTEDRKEFRPKTLRGKRKH